VSTGSKQGTDCCHEIARSQTSDRFVHRIQSFLCCENKPGKQGWHKIGIIMSHCHCTVQPSNGGVGRFDQFRERYAIGRQSIKWWHRIFFYLIDLAIVDAFILWSVDIANGNRCDLLQFRLRLARQLIGDHCTRKRKGPLVAFLAHKKRVPDDVRLVGVGHHMPRVGPTFRRCRLCSSAAHDQRTQCICTRKRVMCLCAWNHASANSTVSKIMESGFMD